MIKFIFIFWIVVQSVALAAPSSNEVIKMAADGSFSNVTSKSSSPSLKMRATSAGVNAKVWKWDIGAGGTMRLVLSSDDEIESNFGMVATRATTNSSVLNWYFPTTSYSGDVVIGETSETNNLAVNTPVDRTMAIAAQNHSTADDTHGIKIVRTATLDRHLTGPWDSGYFAWHLRLNNFDVRGFVFPNDSSWNMRERGHVSTLYTHQFSGQIEADSDIIFTNLFLLNNRYVNDATNGVVQELRGLNFAFSGTGTNSRASYIFFPETSIIATNGMSGIYNSLGPGKTFINDQGGGSNYWTSDNNFNGNVFLKNGSANVPSISFLNSTNTGFNRLGDGIIGIANLGTNWWKWTQLGHYVPITNDFTDIGDSTHQLRTLYASNIISSAAITGIPRIALGANPATNLNTLIGLPYNGMIGWRRTDNSADAVWLGYSNSIFEVWMSPSSPNEPTTLVQALTPTGATNNVNTTINGTLTSTGNFATTGSSDVTSANDVYMAAGGALRNTRFKLQASAAGIGSILNTDNTTAQWKTIPTEQITYLSGNYTNNATNYTLIATASLTNTLPITSTLAAGGAYYIQSSNNCTVTIRVNSGTVDGSASDYILPPNSSVKFVTDSGNWRIQSLSIGKALVRSDIAANTYFTNLTAAHLDVSASVSLTNSLATDIARMSFYTDDTADGTFENTSRNVTLTGVALLSGVEVLSGRVPPGGRWMMTNTSIGIISTSAAGVVSGSCQVFTH